MSLRVVPICPFYLRVSLLKPEIRKKGTLIIEGLLGNLVSRPDISLKFLVDAAQFGCLHDPKP